MNVSSWFRNWRNARRADQSSSVALNHSARLSLRKLEDRQVLSVSASFLGGVLDVAIDSGTDSNPQTVDGTDDVLITVDAFNQVLINGVLVDSDNGLLGVQSLDAMNVSSIAVHDVAGAANTIDLSGVTFANGFTHAGGVSVSLNGGAGADTIIGSGFNDLISGGLGNDALSGGGGNDVYQFQDNFGIDAVIDTGGTADSLDFSAVTSDVAVDLQTHTATVEENSVDFAVAEIDSVVGHAGGNDMLQGLDATSHWDIGAAGTDYSSTGAAIDAIGFETFQGGSLADTFHVGSSGSWTLRGGAGADVFDIDAAFSGTLDGETDSDTLQGTNGSIVGPVTVSTGDRLSPGDSPGILSSGNLAFDNGSTFVVEINDTNNTATSGGIAGTDYDQMQVTGTVTIGTNVTLNLTDLGSTQANAQDVYTIISNDGTDAVSGTFSGLSNGAIVAVIGGSNYRIFYNGGDGNDVVLIEATTPGLVYAEDQDWSAFTLGTLILDADLGMAGNQSAYYGVNAFSTIQEGIDAVATGGTVVVNAGAYDEELLIVRSVTLDGATGLATEVYLTNATGDVITITSTATDVTLRDLSVESGGEDGVDASDVEGSLTFENIRSTGNGDDGFDLRNVGAVSFTDVVATDNIGRGLAISSASSVSINNATITGNTSHGIDLESIDGMAEVNSATVSDNGGAGLNLVLAGSVSLTNIEANNNVGDGISIATVLSSLSLDTVHAGNATAGGNHNGVSITEVYGEVDLVDVTADANAGYGLSLVNLQGMVTVINGGAQANASDGLYAGFVGDLLVNGGNYSINHGNGLRVAGATSLALTDVTARFNETSGVDIADTIAVEIVRGSYSSNVANGLFVFTAGQVTLTDVNASDNQAGGAWVQDGGDSITVTRGTFNGNLATHGLTLLTTTAGTVQISDATATDNAAYGIVVGDASTVDIENTVVSENGFGGLIVSSSGDVTLTDVTADANVDVGVLVSVADSVEIIGGAFINTTDSMSTRGDGIRLEGISGAVTLVDVTATGNFGDGLLVLPVAFLSLPGADSVTISGGRFSTNGGAGIDIKSVTGAVDLSSVTFQDNTGAGFHVSDAASLTLTDVVLEGNDGATITDVATVTLNTTSTGSGSTDIVDLNTASIGGEGKFRHTFDGSVQDIVAFVGVTTLNVNTFDGADVVNVAAHSTTAINLDGGDPTTFADGDTLHFETSDVTLAASRSGISLSRAGQAVVFIQNFEDVSLVGIITFTGAGQDDTLALTASDSDTATYRFETDGVLIATGTLNDVTSLQFDGQSGDDLLVINNPAVGLFEPSNGMVFHGGTGGEGTSGFNPTGDALQLLGGTATTVEHVFSNSHDGAVFYHSAATAAIIYTGLEPILDTMASLNRLFTFNGGAETITVTDSGTAGQSTISSTASESVTFAHPTTSLTISAGTGNDTVNINGSGSGFVAAIVINGDTGFDTINLNSNLSLGDATPGNTGNLTVTAEAIHVTADIATSGTGAISLIASRNVSLSSGSSLTTVDGEMLVQANQQLMPTAGNFVGVDLNNAVIQSTGTGTVTVEGRGGEDGGGSQYGILVSNGGSVRGGTSGTVTVSGTGGESVGNSNYGVFVIGTGAAITSIGGAVDVTGQGGGSGASIQNHGVYLLYSQISAGGIGTVTVDGTGSTSSTGSENLGVLLHSGATITSSGGNVQVTGHGGGVGAASVDNSGVVVSSGSQITAGANGTVTVEGFGGRNAEGNNNFGVMVTVTNAQITSNGGAVEVTGHGGGSGASQNNIGVYVYDDGLISSGSEGTVTVTGTGGSSTGRTNYGVWVQDGTITSHASDVTVTGQGGGVGDAAENIGVVVVDGGQVTAGGAGIVTVDGTGGNTTGDYNYGVLVATTNSAITSSGGAVNVTGQGGGTGTSQSNIGVVVYVGGQIDSGGNGTVTVDGTGGASAGNTNYGVLVQNATITSHASSVMVTGLGGGSGASFSNYGIYLEASGVITAGGSGTVTVAGTGGATNGALNHGVYIANTGAMVTSGGGNVEVTGLGGGTGASIENVGVYVISGGQITAGGTGTVIVEGTGGATTGTDNFGIYVLGIDTVITSNDGNVQVTGFGGGTGVSAANLGVFVANGGQVTAGMSGTVTVEGTGGSTNGNDNYGVFVAGTDALITSSGGDLEVTGQGGGTGASANNIGVTLSAGGQITSTGKVTVHGTGGTTTGQSNFGVAVEGANSQISSTSGNVLVIGGGGGTGVDSYHNYGVAVVNGGVISSIGNGTVTVQGTGGASSGGEDHGVYIAGTGASITAVDGAVQVTGQGGGGGAGALGSNLGVYLLTGGQISASGMGPVTVGGTGGAADGGGNHGLFVHDAGSSIMSGGGAVQVIGFGGGTGISADNIGIVVASAGLISAGAGGTVTVQGTGGTTTGDRNYGVYVVGTDALITSTDNAVGVTGFGGGSGAAGSNYGVFLAGGGAVTAGSTGTVTVDGTGGATTGSNNFGVCVDGTSTTITSGGGNVEVTGLGGGTGAISELNIGTYIVNGGVVTAEGSGTVTVNGTGGAGGGSDNYGVAVADAGSRITSNGGDVSVTGQGGGTGSSNFNHGVFVFSGADITSGPSGMVTVDGTGGATSGTGNHGVFLNSAGTTISSGGGNVRVTGAAGGTGTAADNYGVYLFGGSQLTAGGSGIVTVVGTGSPATGANNIGVRVAGTGTAITSQDGDITVTGIEGGGAFGYAIVVDTDGAITHTADGEVTFIGNSMRFDNTSVVDVGVGTVTIRQFTSSVAIDLGSATDTVGGPLSLSDDELDRITAGELRIGDSNSGAITVSNDINLTTASTVGGGTVPVLCLTSGSTMTGTAGGIVVAGLSISARGAVNFTDTTTNVTNLAIQTSNGNVAFLEADGFTVTTVCGVMGVNSNDGSVSLATTNGDLTVANTGATNDINAATGVTITLGGVDNIFTLDARARVESSAGGISLTADNMTLNGFVSAVGQTVILQQNTTTRQIDLGSETVGRLSLTDGELDQITAAKLLIGNVYSGTITLSEAITRGADTDVTLTTGGDIVFGAAGSIHLAGGDATLTAASGAIVGDATSLTNITATNLTLTARSGIGSTNSLETMVDTLVFTNTTSAHVGVLESDDLVVSGSNSGGGSVSITASTGVLTVAAGGLSAGSGGGITLTADEMTITGTVATAGTVTLHQVTTGQAINLGTNDGVSLSLTDGELDQIMAATLLIGNVSSGTITLSSAITRSASNDVTLSTGSDIIFGAAGSIHLAGGDATLMVASGGIDGNSASLTNITATNVEIVAATGIGSGHTIETQVTNLAFRNTTSGGVRIANLGDLTINSVGSLDGTAGHEVGNFGSGTTSVTATTRLTVAIDTSSIGSMTLTVGEIADAPLFDQDLTINSGVSVSVNGVGNSMMLRAGDDVLLHGAVISAGSLRITAGYNDLDAHGDITQIAAIHVTGTTTLSAPGNIILDNVLNDFGGAVTITIATIATLVDVNDMTLAATSASGNLTVDAVGIHLTNTISVGGNADLNASSGAITDGSTSLSVTQLADFTGSAITLGGSSTTTHFGTLAFHSPGAVSIQEDSATALVGDNTALSLALTSTGAITDGSISLSVTQLADFTGSTITLGGGTTATHFGTLGFHSPGAVSIQEDSATTVSGVSTAGTLTLASMDDVDISALVTVAGNTSISAGQDGSGSFLLAGTGRLVSDNVANTANITINTGATSGHMTLTGTITADNLVTVNSAQSINGAGLVTAQTVDLNAKTGIGNATALELAAASISADTLQGNIDLDNARNTAVTFTSLTTGTGRITVDNDATGGGSATFTTVASSDGTITLRVASGRLTATTVTAGGAGDARLLTTTSGDVIVGSVTATGNDVTITSAGQINDNANDALADITAATTSLTATSGIGVTSGSLDVDATTITRVSAATGGVFLNLLDANNSGVTVTSATATTTGDIVLTATSGSGLKTYSNVNAHQGHVTISAANGNLVLGTIVSDSGVVDTHDVGVIATLGSITLITSVTSDDTVTLTAGAGGVTEQTGSLISADKLLLLGTGPFSLTGANTVGTLAANVNGMIEYVDANSLIVGTVGATQGIITSNDDVTLCLTTGILTLAQSISTGSAGTTTGTVRLQTSGATSQVSQSNGSITASALGIRAGSGGISLNSSTNDVDTLAATTTGSFSYVDMDGFKIGTVAAAGCFTPGVAGLTANGDIEICVMTGDLAVDAALSASGFTIRLNADTGSVTQTIDGIITAENLGVHAQQNISLGLAVNNVTGVFAADSSMSGDIVFHDLGGFTVGSVLTNVRGCVPDVIGVTTASGDVTLSSSGGITVGTGASQSISASGRTVDLHAAGVTEADGSIIHAANLRLQGAGAFTLTEANTVGILAADIQGVLAYNDADGLIVGTVQGTSGLTTNNSDILLHANGNLTLDQSLDAGTADIRLSALGNITQSSTGTITADQLGVRQLSVTGGEISLDDDNDANTFAASNAFAEGTVTYRDVDDLIVGISGTQTIGQLTFGLTSGVTTNHGAVHILTESGHLTLTQAVTTQGTGDVLLETRGAAGDVILNAAVTSGSGHISLIAGDDVDQNAHVRTSGGSIYVLAKNATADAISGIDMLAGTSTSSGGGNILLTAQQEGDIRLGFVNAGTGSVSLSAERSILNSGVALNLQAARLQMVADANHNAAGQIGTADVGNGTPAINANAINTRVAILAAEAADGIYVREADGMTVDDTGPLSVTRVNFNAVTDTVTTTTLEDLVTTDNGPIKLVTQNGTIVIRGGQEAATGVLAHGAGDVLLESRGTASDIVILAGVRSGTGNLTLNAADDVVVSDSLTTGDGGAVFITAANGTHNDAMGPLIDGINLNAGVTTFSGDILLSSAQDIRQTALIVSTHGDVGLIASRHVTQTATGDITTTSGDVLVDAVGTWTMNGDTTITAGGGDVLGQAGEDILLGVIQLTHGTANRVALSAGRSILDTNEAAVNVAETVAAAATSLSLRATSGTIGASGGANPTVNDNALDLNVDTVAAASAAGIFLREISGGGAIQVDTAVVVTVDIEGALRANFNSTTSDVSQTRTLASLEDLTTTANGSIQLMAENGTITVNSGTAATPGIVVHGAGNLLLEARGTASDVVLNGAGLSGTGHVTLIAGDDVSQNADLATTGGSVYLLAGNGSNDAVTGIRMANGTTTSSGGGNILLTAGNEGDISLGRLNAGGGKVSLSAQRDILDNDGTALNVVAATLRMVADSNNNMVGQIGTPGGGAIETTVTTLAAVSADGIDLLETDGLTVDDTGPIAVQQVNFNSSLTSVTVQSLSDVRTTDAGSIAIVSTSGALTVNEGALNATDVAGGVAAGTSGSVWLEATAGDVVTSATVSSLTGPVTIHAGSRAILNAVVTTENDVFVTAASDVIVHDNVIAGRDLSLISTSANIDISASLNAGRDLSLGALVDIDVNVPLHADHAMFVTSGGTTTLTADADITTGAGGLTMIVGQLTTAADFTTESGPISITGPVVLSDNVVWSTNAVGSGGDITVDGTIDGTSDQAEDLTLTSGTADISVTGSVGATTKLGDVLVTQADETTFGGSFAAESFQQLAGRVTTFVGAVVTCGTVELAGTDGFQFTGHSLQFVGGSASLDTTGQDITITTDALTLPTTFVNATGKTVTIQTLSAATSIGLGDASQDMNFTDTQLDVIHSDNIIIGSASNTGGIKIGADGAITQDENYTLLTSASMQVNGLFLLDAAHTLLATIGTDLDITSRGRLETDRGNMTLNVARDTVVAGEVFSNSGELTVNVTHDLTTTTGSVIQSHSGPMTLTIGDDVLHAGRMETGSGPLTLNVADAMDVSGRIVSDRGVVTLDIGHDLRFTATALVQSVSGDITMTAGTATPACDGELFMANGAAIDAGSGLVTMTADDDITLGQVITTNSTVDAIRITSNCAAIIDGGDAGAANLVAESATARVTLRAVTGIGSAVGGGADAALETSVAHLDVVNASNHDVRVSGGVRIDEVNANGLSIRQIDQQGAGDVAITSQGTIVVTAPTDGGSGIHARTGSIRVSAESNRSDLDIRNAIDTTGGNITLLADNDILIGEPGNGVTGQIQSQGGNITLLADDDANADAGSGGLLLMRDGAVIDAATGTIEMRADEDITFASIQTTNATGAAVTLVTRSGGVVDGGDTDRDILADSVGAVVTISAARGVGSGNALETTIAALDVTNSTSGHVRLNEWNAITLARVSQSGGGRVEVVTTNGTITVDNQGLATNAISVGGAGALLLDANGTTSDIVVRDGIQTVDGAITLLADNDIRFDADGDIKSTLGNVTVTADQDNGGMDSGEVVMANGAVLHAGAGTITMTADGSITLGSVQTTNATTNAVRLTSREGGVIDGGDADRDIIADAVGSQVTILSATGVGSTNPLESTIASLSVTNSTSGNVRVDEQNALAIQHIGQQGGGSVVVTTQGTLTVVASGTGITSLGGAVTLTAVGASSDVLVDAPITVIGGTGDITLTGERDVVVHDTGVANDLWVAGEGMIRITVTSGVIVLGSQNPNTTPDVTQHTVANDVVLRTGTGAVTNTLPLVFNVQSPQVTSLGGVSLSMDIGRPGEHNITVTVFWGDGTFTTTTFADPGNYTFEHQYRGNPNVDDQSAPILVNVQVSHDPQVVLTARNVNTPVGSVPDIGVLNPPPVPAQNINTDLSRAVYLTDTRPVEAGPFVGVNSKVFTAPGNEAQPGPVIFQDTRVLATVIPVPGEGLASFPFDVTPPVTLLAIPEATKFLDILQQGGVQLSDSSSSRTEAVRSDDTQVAERLVTLEVLSPDGDVKQRVVLPETVLEEMLDVIGRLPDGKYRFQLQEPGEERQRLLLEFEVRQGKIADDTEASDRPPSATQKKTEATKESSGANPDGGEQEEAVEPGQSIMWSLPPHGIPGEGSDRQPGELSMPANRADGDTLPIWGTWSSIAARRAWKRAEPVAAHQSEPAEWSSNETPTGTTGPTPNGHDHALAGSSVMVAGVMGLWAGITITSPEDPREASQSSVSLSRAAQLFRKYARPPK